MAIKDHNQLKDAIKQFLNDKTIAQLQSVKGDITKLEGYQNTEMAKISEEQQELFTAINSIGTYLMTMTKGLREKELTIERIKNLIDNLPVGGWGAKKNKNKNKSKKQKQKQKTQDTDLTISENYDGPSEKPTTPNNIIGFDDMMLCRAINHIIFDELYNLDPLVGDEGCQARVPFLLDLSMLFHNYMKSNKSLEIYRNLVLIYRSHTYEEQQNLIEALQLLEKYRVGDGVEKLSNEEYNRQMNYLIDSYPLKKSIQAAKNKEYAAMINNLKNEMNTGMFSLWDKSSGNLKEDKNLRYLKGDNLVEQYLSACCAESLYWWDELDEFGIMIKAGISPIFKSTELSRRKAAQSALSKAYVIYATATLANDLKLGVDNVEMFSNLDKNGKEVKQPTMLTKTPNNILSQILYSLQLCSAYISSTNKSVYMLQCWETIHVAMLHALKKNCPLIINLRRLEVKNEDANEESTYHYNMGKTLFYRPTEKGFEYVKEPNETQKRQPGLCILGWSMYRENDPTIEDAKVALSKWARKRDPKAFLDGFTKCDIAKLILPPAVCHPPVNPSHGKAIRLPLTEDEMQFADNKGRITFNSSNDTNGFLYGESIHRTVLNKLKQELLSKEGSQWIDKNKNIIKPLEKLSFPDELPININGNNSLTIWEQFNIWRIISQKAGQQSIQYTGIEQAPLRQMTRTVPFGVSHIYASTWLREDTAIPKGNPACIGYENTSLDQIVSYQVNFPQYIRNIGLPENEIPGRMEKINKRTKELGIYKNPKNKKVDFTYEDLLQLAKTLKQERGLGFVLMTMSYEIQLNMELPLIAKRASVSPVAKSQRPMNTPEMKELDDEYDREEELKNDTSEKPGSESTKSNKDNKETGFQSLTRILLKEGSYQYDFNKVASAIIMALLKGNNGKKLEKDNKYSKEKLMTPAEFIDYYHQINNLGDSGQAVDIYVQALQVNVWQEGEAYGNQLQCLLDSVNQLVPHAPDQNTVTGWDLLLNRKQGVTNRRGHHLTENEINLLRGLLDLGPGMLTVDQNGLADGNRLLEWAANQFGVRFHVHLLDGGSGTITEVASFGNRGAEQDILFYGAHFIPIFIPLKFN